MLFGGASGFILIYREVMSPVLWASWAFTSVVVAVAGPFGTFGAEPFIWRLIYWGALIASAMVIAICLRGLWRNLLNDGPELREDLAVAGSLALVFGPCVVVLNRHLATPDALMDFSTGEAIACVFMIAIATIAIRRAMGGAKAGYVAQVKQDKLLSRIPAENGARLARVCSDNHHVRIMMADGNEHRILMRLRDALDEIDVEDGIIVHRSHWVAKDAVRGVKTVKGRSVVVLSCGAEVPVGPTYRDNLAFAKDITA